MALIVPGHHINEFGVYIFIALKIERKNKEGTEIQECVESVRSVNRKFVAIVKAYRITIWFNIIVCFVFL